MESTLSSLAQPAYTLPPAKAYNQQFIVGWAPRTTRHAKAENGAYDAP